MWLHLLIFTAILATNPEAELLYARPGEVLPVVSHKADVTLEASFGTGAAVPFKTLTAPQEGLHLLAIFARDQLGNLSEPKWYLVQVDQLPPESQLRFSQEPVSDAAGQRWVGPGTEIILQTQDKGSGLKKSNLTINGQPVTGPAASLSRTLKAPGEKEISFSAEDQVGNISPTESMRIALDDAPPQGQIYIEGRQKTLGDRLIVGSDVNVRAEISDTGSGLALWEPRINGKAVGQQSWPSTWKPGNYVVSAFARDRVGNETEMGKGSFQVDTQPPESSWNVSSQVFTNAKGVRYYRQPVTLDLSAQDVVFGACAVEYFNPDQGWLPYESPITINEPYLAIRATDGVGNQLSETLTWPQDLIGPRIKLRNAAGELQEPGQRLRLAQGEELFPEITDEESGISTKGFHFDDGVNKPLPDRFRFRKRDRLVLTIYATDHLGNTSRLQYPITVSRTAKREVP